MSLTGFPTDLKPKSKVESLNSTLNTNPGPPKTRTVPFGSLRNEVIVFALPDFSLQKLEVCKNIFESNYLKFLSFTQLFKCKVRRNTTNCRQNQMNDQNF